MATRKVEVEIIGDASSLHRSFTKASADTDRFGKSVAGAKKGMSLAKVAFVGAGVAATAFAVKGLGSSIQAAIDAEKTQTKLNSTLKDLGQNTPQVKKNIDEMIQSQSQMSGFDDEALAESFINITRATGDSSKALKLNEQAMDLARAKGMDVAKAGQMIAKVYAGNTGALKRLGIEVPKVTDAQDRLKANTEHATDAQKRAAKAEDLRATGMAGIELLQKRLGSQAEDYGQSTAGAAERLGVAWENLQETIGAALAPVLADLANFASRALPEIASKVGSVVSTIVGAFRSQLPIIKPIVEGVFNGLRAAFQILQVAYQSIVVPILQTIRSTFKSTFDGVAADTGISWGKILSAAKTAIAWYAANVVPVIQSAIRIAGKVIRELVSVAQEAWPKIVAYAKQAVAWYSQNVAPVVRAALSAASKAIASLVASAQQSWPKIQAAAKAVVAWYQTNLAPTIKSVVGNIREFWDKFGADIIRITQATFKTVASIVKPLLTAIKATVEVVLAVIRGDWDKAWASLKVAVSNALTAAGRLVQALGTAIVQGLKALGAAAIKALWNQLQHIPGYFKQALAAVPGALVAAAKAIGPAAAQLGVDIAEGIAHGIAGAAGSIASAAVNAAKGGLAAAVDFVKPGSPSKTFRDEIGIPIGQGMAFGIIKGAKDLPKNVEGVLHAGLAVAVASVKKVRLQLRAEFNSLSRDVQADVDKVRKQNAAAIAKIRQEGAADVAKARADVAADATERQGDASKQITRARSDLGSSPSAAQKERVQRLVADLAAAEVKATAEGAKKIKAAQDAASKSLQDAQETASSRLRDAQEKAAGKLADAHKESVQKIRDATQTAFSGVVDKIAAQVDARRTVFTNAFERLAGDAMRAFDATTQKGLEGIAKRFDKMRIDAEKATSNIKVTIQAQLDIDLNKARGDLQNALASIDASGRELTPAEAALRDISARRAQDALDRATIEAQQKLDEALAGGDPREVADARAAVAEAALNQTVAGLEKQAEAERAARDADTEARRAAAEATYAAEEKRLQDLATLATQAEDDKLAALEAKWATQQATEELNYQAQRDLQSRHLQDMLAGLESGLSNGTETWKNAHAKVMKAFREEFGPDLRTAGKNLGTSFSEGLTESFGEVGGAARRLANMIGEYLRLRSPAKKGPLSTLDTWWKPLAPTLLEGVDANMLNRELGRMVDPRNLVDKSFNGASGTPARAAVPVVAPAPASGNTFVVHNYGNELNERSIASAWAWRLQTSK